MLRIKIFPSSGEVFFIELYETDDDNQVDNFIDATFNKGFVDFYEVEYE